MSATCDRTGNVELPLVSSLNITHQLKVRFQRGECLPQTRLGGHRDDQVNVIVPRDSVVEAEGTEERATDHEVGDVCRIESCRQNSQGARQKTTLVPVQRTSEWIERLQTGS